MVPVSAHILGISEVTHDLPSQTDMILGVLVWGSLRPCVPEVQGSPPESSKLTQCVKAGMTPCSAESSCLNILIFSTVMHLMLICSPPFLWALLNSTSLQSLWSVTNLPPFNLPCPSLLNCPSPFSLSSFLLWHLPPFLVSRTSSSDLPSLQPVLSSSQNAFLSVCLSLRLKTFQFSCHKLCSPAQLSKQGGVPFIPPHKLRKEKGRERGVWGAGFNAHVWTQAIISNYCFSFQFPCPDGGPTRRTSNNPPQSSRISRPSESVLVPGTLLLSSQCESGVDSNM